MYTLKEVAELLKVHPKTVLRHIGEGRLKAHKVGRAWRITQDNLRAYSHGELAEQKSLDPPSRPLSERIGVSAVVEIPEGSQDDVQRLSNTIIALLNCKDPKWGKARYELILQPETDVARLALYGTPSFLSAVLAALEVLGDDGNQG